MDAFTQSYIETALWSSTDNCNEQGGEPLDDNYGLKDISPEILAHIQDDCGAFQREHSDDIDDNSNEQDTISGSRGIITVLDFETAIGTKQLAND